MAKTLPDKDIRKLIGTVVKGADRNLINPNGLQLRLGDHILFHSTNEERKLEEGSYLKVFPGESVIFSSLEELDFSKETIQKHYPGCALMAFITPTTTMMREGISQVTTKIDPGFKGVLNWGLRNGSSNDLVIQHSEPMFKLTLMLLDEDEHPESLYGDSGKDSYQNSSGIARSSRRLPVDIPDDRLVHSSINKLDPKKRLEEAGYPFNHISTELYSLHGRFETVSKDVLLLKDQFDKISVELGNKIEKETSDLSQSISNLKEYFTDKIDYVFSNKFNRFIGVTIGGVSILISLYAFAEKSNLSGTVIGGGMLVIGIAMISISVLINGRSS